MASSKFYQAWIDGACRGNPGKAAIGGVLATPKGDIIYQFSQFIGVTTNNVAEYRALIHILTAVKEFIPKIKMRGLVVYSDSQLVVCQMKGSFKIRKKHLVPLFHTAKELISELPLPVEIVYVDRCLNGVADRLANEAFADC